MEEVGWIDSYHIFFKLSKLTDLSSDPVEI